MAEPGAPKPFGTSGLSGAVSDDFVRFETPDGRVHSLTTLQAIELREWLMANVRQRSITEINELQKILLRQAASERGLKL